MELAKEIYELASNIVVGGIVPNDVSLRQVVESDCSKSLAEAAQKRNNCIRRRCSTYADKKKLLFGPLSVRTQLAETRLRGTRKTKSQQHSEGCSARLAILCGEGASKPRRSSELHQTQNYQPGNQGQQQPSSATWRN